MRTPCKPVSPPATRSASSTDDTDWEQIIALYEALGHLTPSPAIELNRAVAAAMGRGPAEALVVVDELVAQGQLADYPFLPSVRGELWRAQY